MQNANLMWVLNASRSCGLTNAVTGIPTTPAAPGSVRQNSAASVAPPDVPNTNMQYFPTEVGGWTGAGSGVTMAGAPVGMPESAFRTSAWRVMSSPMPANPYGWPA